MKQGAMLEGVRIIDMTTVVFGPYCTQMLAELGADVIKVERPAGDTFRQTGTPATTVGMGACHMTLNRGKRSIVLDMKQDEDKAVLRDLIASADVFIHNVREKAIARLGFDYAGVKAIKPDIVYAHCVGFAQNGPYADLQAYDDVIQTASGATTLPSRVDGDPRPRYIPSTIADKVAGLYGANAVLAAIIHKLRTGEGQRVEVPMFEAFTQFMLEEHLFNATFDPPTGPAVYPRQVEPTRQPFPTADGFISIVVYAPAIVTRMLELLGCADILEDERFGSPPEIMANMRLVYPRIAEQTATRTTDDLIALCHAAQIPAMPVRDIADIRNDPHLRATGFFQRETHPTEGGYFAMRPPVRFGAAPDIALRHAPLVDEHGAEIRAELIELQHRHKAPI